MAFIQALRENKKTYIVLISMVTVVIVYNESIQFWEGIQSLTVIGYFLLIALLVLFINLGIKLKIWEREK